MMRSKLFMFSMLILGLSPLRAEDIVSEPVSTVESKSALSVEIKIGTGLENRDVVGEADSFAATTTQLVGWTRVSGAAEPTQITHVWKFNGQDAGSVPLIVKSSPFRTYSRKTVMGTGTYTLQVSDTDGHVIASKDVTIQAAP